MVEVVDLLKINAKKYLLAYGYLVGLPLACFSANNFYLQANTQVAATNFDYVSTYYLNSSVEAMYNFTNSPFIVGGGFGEIYGTTDSLYASNGGSFNSSFTVPYVTIMGGVLFNPLPRIKNVTTVRIAQSFSGQSNCNASSGYICNPESSSVDLTQLGFRNSTMYFFTPSFYMAFNAGLDINSFTFSPSFSSTSSPPVSSRTYHSPGPNLGLSIGYSF
jgi:hypothetical protein